MVVRSNRSLHRCVAAIIIAALVSLLPVLWCLDPRMHLDKPSGLSGWWIFFGFAAQAMFAGRLVVQWVASERSRKSVVPMSFWWLSLIGGTMLLVYFWRRGDPVGTAGQLFGNVVYLRNIYFIVRDRRAPAQARPSGAWPEIASATAREPGGVATALPSSRPARAELPAPVSAPERVQPSIAMAPSQTQPRMSGSRAAPQRTPFQRRQRK